MINQVLISTIESGLIYGLIAALVAIILTPTQYLKVQRQEFGVSYPQIIRKSWKKDGIRAFFCGCLPYVIWNAISSASFGLFDYIALKAVHNWNLTLWWAIFFRIIMGGLSETLGTIYFEIKNILQSKIISEKKIHIDFLTVSILLFIRNSVNWIAAIIIVRIIPIYHLNNAQINYMSFTLGVVFGVLSTPLDILITKNCGTCSEQKNIFRQLFEICFRTNYRQIFNGGLMRFIQTGIYAIMTTLTMILIEKTL